MKIDPYQKTCCYKMIITKGISIVKVKVAFQMTVVQQALKETTPDWSRLEGSGRDFKNMKWIESTYYVWKCWEGIYTNGETPMRIYTNRRCIVWRKGSKCKTKHLFTLEKSRLCRELRDSVIYIIKINSECY